VKTRHRGRKPDDLTKLRYPLTLILQKLWKYRDNHSVGVRKRKLPKSKTIHLWDIAIIAKIERNRLYRLMYNKPNKNRVNAAGFYTLQKLCDALDLVDSGCVTKIQHGVYKITDEPQVAPKQEMRVCLDSGRIAKEVKTITRPQKMPDFSRLFGGK